MYSYCVFWYNPVTKIMMQCKHLMTQKNHSSHLELTVDMNYTHMERMNSTNVMRTVCTKTANDPLTDIRLMNSSSLIIVK